MEIDRDRDRDGSPSRGRRRFRRRRIFFSRLFRMKNPFRVRDSSNGRGGTDFWTAGRDRERPPSRVFRIGSDGWVTRVGVHARVGKRRRASVESTREHAVVSDENRTRGSILTRTPPITKHQSRVRAIRDTHVESFDKRISRG